MGTGLFVACADLGLEGVVAKWLTSVYRPGKRSKDWVKARCPTGGPIMRPDDTTTATRQLLMHEERSGRVELPAVAR